MSARRRTRKLERTVNYLQSFMRPASILLFSVVALATLPACAADLVVKLSGKPDSKGTLSLAVVDSAAHYDKVKAVRTAKSGADGAQREFHFDGLPAGRYAVLVTQDENGNGRFDLNKLHMPAEAYGFSNNPHVWRKPNWNDSSFELPEAGTTITVELR